MGNENENGTVLVIAAEEAAGCFGCVNVCVFWLTHSGARVSQLYSAPFVSRTVSLSFPPFAQVSQTVSLVLLSVPFKSCSLGHCVPLDIVFTFPSASERAVPAFQRFPSVSQVCLAVSLGSLVISQGSLAVWRLAHRFSGRVPGSPSCPGSPLCEAVFLILFFSLRPFPRFAWGNLKREVRFSNFSAGPLFRKVPFAWRRRKHGQKKTRCLGGTLHS